MSITEPRTAEALRGVKVPDDDLIMELADGRTISAPLAWYPKLFHATRE